ncbi:hypothetical protein BZA77DRAFT_354913 [Pyronema omphalodes]|nr:hypothetical protein BZA77DRAFT_354913 [Pyronema omphalodes]
MYLFPGDEFRGSFAKQRRSSCDVRCSRPFLERSQSTASPVAAEQSRAQQSPGSTAAEHQAEHQAEHHSKEHGNHSKHHSNYSREQLPAATSCPGRSQIPPHPTSKPISAPSEATAPLTSLYTTPTTTLTPSPPSPPSLLLPTTHSQLQFSSSSVILVSPQRELISSPTQSFESPPPPCDTRLRFNRIHSLGVTVCVVQQAEEHNSTYIPPTQYRRPSPRFTLFARGTRNEE